MRILLWDRHRDRIGGGTMPMIALFNGLVKLGHDVWVYGGFHPQISSYEFIEWAEEPKTDRIEDPDLFIHSSYWHYERPWGKRNWLYCLYPRPIWDTSAYGRILTLSKYSRKAIKDRWNRDSDILIGGVWPTDWFPIPVEENAILSCARFFIEGDVKTLKGHSKNQHVLIRAFQEMDTDWGLWLAGSVLSPGDSAYFHRCQELAEGDERIKFFPMLGKFELRELFQRAKIFWHGMGYGRPDPAEVEHFGYVALKARLCGQWVVTHHSGNLDLSDATWNTPAELVDVTSRIMAFERPPPRVESIMYSEYAFLEDLERLVNSDT